MRTELILEPITYLIENYKVPEIQRIVDNTHIDRMIRDQVSEYKKYNNFSMIQSFTVAYNLQENKGYILDGQHRLEAYSKLRDQGYNIDNILIPIVKYNVNSEEEVNDYFYKINKHSPIRPIFNIASGEKDIIQKLVNYYTENYFKGHYNDEDNDKIMERYNSPHISLHNLGKHVKSRNIIDILGKHKKTTEDFISIIKDLNVLFETTLNKDLCYGSYVNNFTAKYELCRKKQEKTKCPNVCFLGIFRNYEWLDIAIHILSNSSDINVAGHGIIKKILSKGEKKRETIPYDIRKKVWKKYNSGDMTGKCYVCDNVIEFKEMECSHIIAYALGGDISLDNLQPCCKSCNRDMGIMNLEEYKKLLLSMK
jgi:hypothetical protein